MWIRIVCAGAAALALAGPAAAQGSPRPPANDDCLACHDTSPDLKAFASSTHGPLACIDCHADLSTTTEFPHAESLARVSCGSCHDAVASTYHDSIHAWAKEKAGLVGAPGCADCHGRHDIRPHGDPASRVHRVRVPATCGSCHKGIRDAFDAGVHAAALKKGDSRAPACSDCHTAHAVQRVDVAQWRLDVTAECGSCHASVVESFRRTFHGKVTELGFTRVAACADCHGAHDILPRSNPASTISTARLVETCGKCHPGANASFVAYDAHPDPRNRSRSAALWWANRFYWILIPGCFGFFGLHSALWFWRARKDGDR
jgi:hypothetical protein